MRVIGRHLILTGYGHWLPNDIRGSGSQTIKQEKLAQLGPIHYGRKDIQPSREELRAFHRHAKPLLKHEPLWFDRAMRQAIGESFAQVIHDRGWTVWACAICKNHAHLCIRAHRDSAQTMWALLTDASRKKIREFPHVPPDHEIWTRAPYAVFFSTPEEVWARIRYINRNPTKELLEAQTWSFVVPYNNWPLRQTIP